MMAHRQHMHGTEPAIDWSRLPVSQTEHRHQVYDVRFCVQPSDEPAPSPAARGPPVRGMAYAYTLVANTGGIGSGSWRNTPTPSPIASAAGAKS